MGTTKRSGQWSMAWRWRPHPKSHGQWKSGSCAPGRAPAAELQPTFLALQVSYLALVLACLLANLLFAFPSLFQRNIFDELAQCPSSIVREGLCGAVFVRLLECGP